MQETDVALRTLVDRALAGFRSWRSAAPLAHEAGVGDKITYKLLARVASIGAITRHRGGGFSVTDTERLTMILAARRTLKPARHTTLEAAQALAGTVAQYAIGGTRAAAHHLGGPNTVATHGAAILYVPEGVDLDDLPRGRHRARDGRRCTRPPVLGGRFHQPSTDLRGPVRPARLAGQRVPQGPVEEVVRHRRLGTCRDRRGVTSRATGPVDGHLDRRWSRFGVSVPTLSRRCALQEPQRNAERCGSSHSASTDVTE